MKKTLAILLALAMVFSTVTVAFAEGGIGTDAQACVTLGMLEGNTSAGVTADYLVTTPTRIQAALLFLRLKGLEDKALEFTGTDNFVDANQVKWDGYKAVMAYLKANPELGFKGIGNDKFDPNGLMTASSYYKVVLTALGYKQTETDVVGDFLWADVLKFAEEKGLKNVKDVTNFTVNDLAIATIEGLKATVKDSTKTLAAALIDAKAITEAAALEAGVYTAPVVATLDIDSATAINSKVVEVTLNTAATAVDAKNITVKDAAGTEVAVASAELAAYDTENETVLVTLAADTTVGTLYTITSGTTSANFGGRAVDSTKPTVKTIVSDEYNKVAVTFSEPVRLDGATFVLAEKYGAKAALAVTNMEYDGNDTIVLTTADQKASTLYGAEISGVTDFAGNTMDKVSDKTFVGTAKSTTKLAISSAEAVDYNKVILTFNEKIDADKAAAATYTVAEAYGTKAAITVTSAAAATATDMKDTVAYAASSLSVRTDKAKYCVVLNTGDLKASTLYKVTVSGLTTAYGVAMDTADGSDNITFVGKAKPASDSLTYTTPVATSNTTINVTFANKLDKATAENVANYAITEAYGTKAALAVTKAELQTGSKTVKLTVAAMKNVLYKMTVTNVADIYGNTVKTSDDVNIQTFVGATVADKISTFTAAVDTTDNTQLVLTFAVPVAADATDVAHYFIDNNIGYPATASVDTTGKIVTLTIPKTTDGKIYKIKVTGLNNADGVVMDAAGVEKTFVGRGVSATLPEAQAVVTLSNNKLQVFFDRAVTDSSLKTFVWSSTAPGTINNSSIVVKANYTGAPAITITGVYADPSNTNALILVAAANSFKANQNSQTYDTLNVTFNKTYIKGTSDNTNTVLTAACNSSNSYGPVITGVVANDVRNLTVYFDQPVTINSQTALKVYSDTAMTYDMVTSDIISLSSDKMVANVHFDGNIAEANASTSKDNQYTLKLTTLGDIEDITGTIASKDDDTTTPKTYQSFLFAGNTKTVAAGVDSGIYAMFTDKQTMTIYFPQAMDATTVDTFQGATASDITVYETYNGGNATFTPAYISYDADTLSATAYFSAPVVDATHSDAVFQLKLTNNVKTETNIVVCADKTTANTPYLVQVAPSATAAKGPELVSATVNDGRNTITVKFNMPVVFNGTNVGAPVNSTTPVSYTAADATDILKGLVITGTYGDDVAINGILTGTDVTSVDRNASEDTIVITLKKALKAGSNGTVTLSKAVAGAYSWTSVVNDATTDSKVTFGVTSNPLHDLVDPNLSKAEFTSATTLVLTFDEAVNAVLGDFTAVSLNNNSTGTATAYTISAIAGSGTNVITLTVAGTGGAIEADDTGVINVAGTVTDLAGNTLTAIPTQPVAAGF